MRVQPGQRGAGGQGGPQRVALAIRRRQRLTAAPGRDQRPCAMPDRKPTPPHRITAPGSGSARLAAPNPVTRPRPTPVSDAPQDPAAAGAIRAHSRGGKDVRPRVHSHRPKWSQVTLRPRVRQRSGQTTPVAQKLPQARAGCAAIWARGARIRMVNPTTADTTEPDSTPARTAFISAGSSKLSEPMNSDMVNPIPARQATP